MLQLFGRWEGEERQEFHVSEGVEPGFIGHAYDQNERLREGKRHMARGIKLNFRASRIVLVKYQVPISLCAYRRYLQKSELGQTASTFSKYSMSFKHNDIPCHLEPSTDYTNSFKHNDIPEHSGSNTACQAFAISECELTCLVAWP